jgi:hypothetical protein
MSDKMLLDIDEVMPTRDAVLAHQGIPAGATVSQRILNLHARAEEIFATCARPVGMIAELDSDAFLSVFEGNGDNADDAVVGLLVPTAEKLALYAATLGAAVGGRIDELFANDDFALGAMLDAVASMAAEKAADALSARYRDHLRETGALAPEAIVLGYSPGYCGWNISGQRPLFARLRPGAIGIRLNARCMMSPLKSVSGVLVAASARAHVFTPRFSYCPDCRQRSCIGRMQPLREMLRSA